MATSFVQQARLRKRVYAVLAIALLTGAWLWRQYVVQPQAQDLALREEDVGEVEVLGQAVRLSLTGSRGLATCALWITAIEKQKKNEWNELELVVRAVTKLQPHFITPWLFQSWNLSYNVSVESDQPKEKYFYVARGIQLLAEGERRNRNQPDLRREIGFYHQHKICRSDENNVMRSLFNLSLIPPAEREAANFRNDKGEIDREKFAKFCREHPHLVRRLHSPPLPYDPRREYPKFSCASIEEVLQFFEDSRNVPSLYAEKLEDETRYKALEVKRNPRDRFPVLPPNREVINDREVWGRWTEEQAARGLPDESDAYGVAGAWYNYAQEAVPEPSDTTPGASKPVTDRMRTRLPRFMSTTIFRTAPARAETFMADRLEEEGWFDGERFSLKGWFGDSPGVVVGSDRAWSREAWRAANEAWKRFGRRTHLWFELASDKENMERLDAEFRREYKLKPYDSPPPMREEMLSPEMREAYQATLYLIEYEAYRRMTNFPHFLIRSEMEAKPETIQARKLFYEAEQLRVAQARRIEALSRYEDPRALRAWRTLLESNKEFRSDDSIQEQSMEIQMKYLDLYTAVRKEALQKELAEQLYTGQFGLPTPLGADWMTLTLRERATLQPPPKVVGPFDGDYKGVPLIGEVIRKTVEDRSR